MYKPNKSTSYENEQELLAIEERESQEINSLERIEGYLL